MPRLFTAIDLPVGLAESIVEQHHGLEGAVWEPLPHITLAHFGDVAEEDVADLERELETVPVQTNALTPTELGFFPDEGDPEVVWVGLGESTTLTELADNLQLVRTAIAGGTDALAFRPHITIARTRKANPADVHQYAQGFDCTQLSTFTYSTFTLFKSTRSGYETVRTFG